MHLLSVNDLSKEQITGIFIIADDIKEGKGNISLKESSQLALLFEKPSTRTRVSFQSAMTRLGGDSIYIDTASSQVARGESYADTARVLSLYVDFIAARMHNHSDLLVLAENSRVPVINALTDLEHPTQALADIYTIQNKKRKIKGLRIAFTGDIAQNTVNSLMLAAVKLGAQMSLIAPKNYQPNIQYLTKAREYGIVDIYNDLEEGLDGADIIYTDTFVSMGKEKESEERKKMFSKYQINSRALEYAKRDVYVMHPLPAFRGEEITDEVLEGSRSLVWEQAASKLIVAQAIILYLSEKEM